MLGEIGPTEYDLRFSCFGIPVRVHPFFWVAACVLGYPSRWEVKEPKNLLPLLIVAVACIFVSILVHEMGHAVAARHYGYAPEIVLYHFGGYAQFHPTWGYTLDRAVKILLAGPGAGFALYGVVRLIDIGLIRFRIVPGGLGYRALDTLLAINLWWSILNLLPIFPLDGGQITRHLLTAYRPYGGVRLSLQVSMVVGGAAALFMFSRHDQFAALLFGLLAFQSFQALQEIGRF